MIDHQRQWNCRLAPDGLEKLKEGIVSGYASVFDVKDSWGTKLIKGAFTETIDKEFKEGKVKFLWQHKTDEPIGKILSLEEDDKGLLGEAKVSQTTRGKDALILLNDGSIDGLSIGFWTLVSRWRDDTTGDLIEPPEDWWDMWFNPIYQNATEEILVARLAEYSVVTYPANDQATVESVRSLRDKGARFAALAAHAPEQAHAQLFEMMQTLKAELDAIKSGKDVPIEVPAVPPAVRAEVAQMDERARDQAAKKVLLSLELAHAQLAIM
jgi:HK97 family phage prohead protease